MSPKHKNIRLKDPCIPLVIVTLAQTQDMEQPNCPIGPEWIKVIHIDI